MSEIVERVAKAIALSLGEHAHWKEHVVDARAAIEAMRDLPEEPGPRYTAGEYSRRNVNAMVEDALR